MIFLGAWGERAAGGEKGRGVYIYLWIYPLIQAEPGAGRRSASLWIFVHRIIHSRLTND